MIEFYLVGAALVIPLMATKFIWFRFLLWMTNAHIYNRNIEKLGLYVSPITGSYVERRPSWKDNLWIVPIEVLASWVNVAFACWQLLSGTMATMKTLMSRKPQAIEELNYPLYHSEQIEAEAVWARLYSLGTMITGPKDHEDLKKDLSDTSARLRSFSKPKALLILKELKVVNTATVDQALIDLAA